MIYNRKEFFMRCHSIRKPMVKYRFKDKMGCVWFKVFMTDREARLWYERNKAYYEIVEFGNAETR